MENTSKKFSLKNTELISWYTLLFGFTMSLTVYNAFGYLSTGIDPGVMTYPLFEPFTLLVFYLAFFAFCMVLYQFLINHIWYKVFLPFIGGLVLVIPFGYALAPLYNLMAFVKSFIPDDILLIIASILKGISTPFQFLGIWGPVILLLLFTVLTIVQKLIIRKKKKEQSAVL